MSCIFCYTPIEIFILTFQTRREALMSPLIPRFYAVTTDGEVWHIERPQEGNGSAKPNVSVIAHARQGSYAIGNSLRGEGSYVGITLMEGIVHYGIQGVKCQEQKPYSLLPEEPGMLRYDLRTHPISSLYADEEHARRSLNLNQPLLPWDWRRVIITYEVLCSIKADDPHFFVDGPVRERMEGLTDFGRYAIRETPLMHR
jgi:hypothetical protein